MALIFFTTFSKKTDATRFARAVVSKRLAACVNIIPRVQSIYRWKGHVESAHEILVIGKSTRRGFSEIKKKLKSLHPYEVPELISLNISDGSSKYLSWIKDSVQT